MARADLWWRRWDLNPRPRVFPKDFLRAQLILYNSLMWRHVSRLHNHYPVVPLRYRELTQGFPA